jgi:TonB family protein
VKVRSRSLLPALLVPVLLLAAAPPSRAANNNAELQDQLKKAADLSTPNVAGLKPWHAKLSVQLSDLKGSPTGTGTVEEWWMAPGNEKRVFAFPDYQGTEIITSDGIYRSPNLASEPMLIADVVDQLVNPMAAETKTAGFKPLARTLQLGGVTMPCVMLAKSNNRVADQPLGFYPSWCTEPGKEALRVYVDDGGIAIVRNGISSFQGKDIPTDVGVTFNGVTLASAHLEAISLEGMPTAPFTPDRDMLKAVPKPFELKGKRFQDQADKHTPPDFSQAAGMRDQSTRNINGGLQGDVEIRVWVGEDGQIRDMLLLSYPAPGVAQTAFDAVRQWTFHPYMQEGRAVPFTGTVDFEINPGFDVEGVHRMPEPQ